MRTALRPMLLAAIFSAAMISAAVDVPYLTGRVTDNAEILPEPLLKSLTERLKAHEDRTGNQIVVVTTPSLEGENPDGYAGTVFKEWKLGQEGKDNGILIMVAPQDHRLRLDVSYGLQAAVPDSLAGNIIRNGGIEAGVNAILTVLEDGNAPALDSPAGEGINTSSLAGVEAPDMSITERILFGAFIFGIIGLFTVFGILTPGVGWFLYFFLIPFWAMFPIVIVGTAGALKLLLTYLVGFPVAKLLLRNTDWYSKAALGLRTKGHATIGGFTVSSGSSRGSWSSGGSSPSEGGGSSGGSGASGSW